MSSNIAELASDGNLARLATRSDRRLGRQILDEGGVLITSSTPRKVTAFVTPVGGQKRTVEMTADENGLHCRCT